MLKSKCEGVFWGVKVRFLRLKSRKTHFFENFFPKRLQIQKKAVPLHRF